MRLETFRPLAVAACAVASLGSGATADTAADVLEKVNGRLEREFISAEGLLLDYVGDIPDAREIAENRPNAMGWWTPIENGSMFTGEWLHALMAEGRSKKALVERCVKGLIKMSEVSDVPGFIARGTGLDGRSHYPCGSNDQTDPWFLGLVEYCRWPHADPAVKSNALDRLVFVARALEANGWGVPCDGAFKGENRGNLCSKGMPFWGKSRLLYSLKALHRLTGDAHWGELYRSIKASCIAEIEAGGEVDAKRFKACFGDCVWIYVASAQMLARLIELEDDAADRERMRKGLLHYAERVAPLMELRLKYDNAKVRPFRYANWREGYYWRPQKTQKDAEAVAYSPKPEVLGDRKAHERNFMSVPLAAAAVCALSDMERYREEILLTLRHYDYATPNISEFFHAAIAAAAATSAQPQAAAVTVQNDSGKAEAADVVTLAVDPAVEIGPIKPMNAVNNGPSFSLDPNRRKEQRSGWFVHYRNLRAPMARFHDTRGIGSPPNHAVDINCIFTDWDADENDPKSYDFTITDWVLNSTRLAGTEIMFRLGNSADQGPKRYGSTDVPKDFGKWARVAEHIIRHYNEGWAWTTEQIPFKDQFKVKYWEIWNEADLGCPESYWTTHENYWNAKPRYWNGPPESFFKFYATVAKHLKATFPDMKIGGPSVAGIPHWTDRFLGYCATNSVPIDFFSWHIYADRVEQVPEKAAFMKKLLVQHGYGNAESVLNEWDWITGWYGDEFRSSTRIRTGLDNFKMAAFYAGVMSAMQDSSADMLMYYDARLPTRYNGIFDYYSERPTKGYYALYAWAKMRDLGTQVKAALGRKGAGIWVTAAKGADGAVGIYLARYTLDANVVKNETVRITVAGRHMSGARCHLTDDLNRYTEVPLAVLPDGSAEIDMDPNAFAFIELPRL